MGKIVGGVPFNAARVRPVVNGGSSSRADVCAQADDNSHRVFDIRVADRGEAGSAAGILVDRMYATRGYISNGLSRRARDRRITLVASEAEEVVGTLTLGFDHEQGLLVDELFSAEADAMRNQGLRLCEFTKLAIDEAMKSRRLIASLFHAAYIFAHPLMGADRLLIEVNPRHVVYYRRMLGFEVVSEARCNPRVNAPAVLMALDLARARREIAAVGGSAVTGSADSRSLYPFGFSPAEERAILQRARLSVVGTGTHWVRLGVPTWRRSDPLHRPDHQPLRLAA